MAVKEILDELENIIVDGRHIAFTDKILIDESELVRLVDALRNELPMELQDAERVMSTKEDIIAEARDEAQRILEQAKEYANKLVEESSIVQQSEQRAREIRTATDTQAHEIMEDTMATAQQRCDQVNTYGNQVFDHMLAHLDHSMQTLAQSMQTLQQAKSALGQAPIEPAQPRAARHPMEPVDEDYN